MNDFQGVYLTDPIGKTIFLSLIFLLGFICTNDLNAQDIKNEGVVEYAYRNNGKDLPGALKMYFKDDIVFFHSERNRHRSRPQTEKQYIDYKTNQTYQVLSYSDDEIYIVKKSFSGYDQPVSTDDTLTILGYECRKATLTIRSNKIEVWYTNEPPIKGSPSISVAPGLGLILKMIRNNSYEVYATKIDLREVTADELNFNIKDVQEVDVETYKRKVIDSRYQTISVFSQEIINFGDEIINPAEDQNNVTYRYSKGTAILKKITLPAINPGTYVIAELATWSNGDAYDRTGSLFMIPVEKEINFLHAFQHGIEKVPVYKDRREKEYQGVVATENYEPPLELMRFFTPFGVGQFNEKVKIKGYDWADSVLYRQEISDLLPQDSSDIWIGIFIGNYDKGGHMASLNLKVYPSFRPEESLPKWIKPLFNTVNIMEMSGQNYGTMFHEDSLRITFEVPDGLKDLELRFTSTGHGGWGGGDEFNPKLNEIFIDDERVYAFIPWRTDCATYRLYNPSSGNFGNGLSSSDLSRSNWCPGSLTVPEIIKLDNITPGKHTMKIAIPIGEREGGSFSAWNISGTLIGTFE